MAVDDPAVGEVRVLMEHGNAVLAAISPRGPMYCMVDDNMCLVCSTAGVEDSSDAVPGLVVSLDGHFFSAAVSANSIVRWERSRL